MITVSRLMGVERELVATWAFLVLVLSCRIVTYAVVVLLAVSNIAQSFGGHCIHDTDNTELWVQNEGVAAIEFSNDAKRVSETMYQHIRSRGQCVDVDPNTVVPIQGCASDPDCNDGNPCNGVETCD